MTQFDPNRDEQQDERGREEDHKVDAEHQKAAQLLQLEPRRRPHQLEEQP